MGRGWETGLYPPRFKIRYRRLVVKPADMGRGWETGLYPQRFERNEYPVVVVKPLRNHLA